MRTWSTTSSIGMALLGLAFFGPIDVRAATEPPAMAPGGGQSPATGGRIDEQAPQLGSGNRGSGLRGTEGGGKIDPGNVRSSAQGPGTIIGQVLSIQGDTYIIREPNGHEVTLNPTQQTEMPTVIGMGDRVEAQIDRSGAVTQIKPAAR